MTARTLDGLPVTTVQTSLTLSAATRVRLGPGGSRSVPFWDLVDQSGGPDACWPWTGRRDGQSGYGRGYFGWTKHAHRNAYLLAHPEGFDRSLDVCHHCDNPPCCNPAHLFAGTHQENLLDAGRKGRLGKAHGESHGNAKLDWTKVHEIRRLAAEGTSEREIARRFGVSQPCIHFVVARVTWTKGEPTAEEAAA